MFYHNFKYTFKIILKNKNLVFWSILWPIILVSLFYMAFSNMFDEEQLDIINIGVVQNDSFDKQVYLSETLKSLSDKNSDNYMFDIVYSTKDELDTLLDDKKIDGYIEVNKETTKINVKDNGINETIIKYVVDEVESYQNLVSDIVNKKINNGNIPDLSMEIENIKKGINENKEYTNNLSNKNMNYMMIEYYTVIAMASLYSSLISIETIKNCLANINKKGARVAIAPIKRLTLILSSLLSGFIIQMISISILIIYMKWGLKVDFGEHFNLVCLLVLIGSIAGLTLGTLVGSKTFKNENTRIGVMNVIVMFGCFCAGMMGVTEKYIIDTNIPLLNKINPANMITDGFYSLYYYEDLSRFYFNIISLLIVIIICIVASCLLMRRKKYDSI